MQTGNDSDDDWEYTPKPMTDEAFDENLEYFKSHPLFLNQLPENFEQNEAFSALRNIAFDDEPINIAKSLNNKARQILARGSEKYYLREAMKTYDDALLQEFNDDELKSRIYSNKSLVHYKLKNFGKAIEDALQSIKLNPSFIKPYFRAAQGYLVLDKFVEVIKISDEGLLIDPQCKEIINIKKEAEREIEKAKEREAKAKLEINSKQSQLVESFRSRGYILGKKRIHEIPGAYQMNPFVDSDGALNFVTIVTYLEFHQMDVIQQTRDTDLLSDHLREIFKEKLPWDEKGYYNYADLAIFIELNCVEPMYKSSNHTNFERGFLRIGRKKQLSEILKINGVVMPYILEINVLSRKSPFFDKFMKDFDIIKGV